MLETTGLSEDATDEARNRHEYVQRIGRIDGQMWAGRIFNARNHLVREFQ